LVTKTVASPLDMPDAVLDLRVCLEAARRHDEDACSALIAHLYPLVIKIVRAHRPKRMDEEDMAQTVFVKVFAHLDQFRGEVPLEHWVSRVAVNTCLNQLRSEKSKPELRWADLNEEEAMVLEKALFASQEPGPDERFAARDAAEKLLEMLSPDDRLVLTLLDLEDRSVKEIREITGWNVSLIKVRAFRARLKLRKQLCRLAKNEN